MPQTTRITIINEDHQIIKASIGNLKRSPIFQLIVKANTSCQANTLNWNQW